MYTAAESYLMSRLFVILLAITIVLWLLLRKRSEAVKSIPFIVITLALIVGEVIKQVKCYRYGYTYWDLPLHFCSTYFIWFTMAEISVGKLRKTMQNIAFISTFYGVIGMYVSPSGIFGAGACENMFIDYFTAHSIIFHHLVALYLMLSIALHRFHPKKSDAVVWVICFTVYFAVAFYCSYVLETNFFNIRNSESIPILETFRLQVGQVVYNACLWVVLCLGGIVLWISAWISGLLKERRSQEEEWIAVTVER